MVADPRKMQENQGFSENRIDKFSLAAFKWVQIPRASIIGIRHPNGCLIPMAEM